MTMTRSVLLLYNLLQALTLPWLGPPILLYFISRSKHRGQLAGRLGRLPDLSPLKGRSPRIWVHALSVGEVNATLALVAGIAQRWHNAGIICSSTTATGLSTLRKRLGNTAHVITTSPFDLLPIVNHVIKGISPDCFVLVETDIWPNWIWDMKRLGIPTLLINGSISSRSAARLLHLGPVKDILYRGLDSIAMQSPDDRERILRLGMPSDRIKVLGNLKYDLEVPPVDEAQRGQIKREMGLKPDAPLWVAGSTHPGEEELILAVHKGLKDQFPGLQLLLAPRDPRRGGELKLLAEKMGLKAIRRSLGEDSEAIDVLVLDTLGELLRCYGLCDIAFVGGSFVDIEGHNLLEPAAYGVPVLFGPRVESIHVVAEDLLRRKGGRQVSGREELEAVLCNLLKDPDRRRDMGMKAKALLHENRGAASRYLDYIAEALQGSHEEII